MKTLFRSLFPCKFEKSLLKNLLDAKVDKIEAQICVESIMDTNFFNYIMKRAKNVQDNHKNGKEILEQLFCEYSKVRLAQQSPKK